MQEGISGIIKITVCTLFLLVLSVFSQAAERKSVVAGKILESIEAEPYTYLHLETRAGKQWIAVPKTEVRKGEEVYYIQGMVMKNFESPSLGKVFKEVVFSEGLVDEKTAELMAEKVDDDSSRLFEEAVRRESMAEAEQRPDAMLTANPGGSKGAIMPKTSVETEKAEGENGHRVVEIFENADSLKERKVRVRGMVVKVNRNIMGKNWVHLQDGTGDSMKNSHDLVITTTADVTENSVVELEGVVKVNRDFGAGYSYEVIVEQGVVVSEK